MYLPGLRTTPRLHCLKRKALENEHHEVCFVMFQTAYDFGGDHTVSLLEPTWMFVFHRKSPHLGSIECGNTRTVRVKKLEDEVG